MTSVGRITQSARKSVWGRLDDVRLMEEEVEMTKIRNTVAVKYYIAFANLKNIVTQNYVYITKTFYYIFFFYLISKL